VICFHACMGSRGAEKIFHHLVNYWFGETKFNFINLKLLEFQGLDLKLEKVYSPYFFCQYQ